MNFRWEVLETAEGPVSGWRCSGEDPTSSLVMVQSTAQSRLMCEPMARAVARRGFSVFVPTPGGNLLRNAVPLEQQRAKIVAAVRYFREQGSGRVYLSGHSIGANQAVLAAYEAEPDGVVAIGYDVEAPRDRSWSLLLVAGIYDQLHPAWKIKATAAQALGFNVPEPGRLYPGGAYLLSPLSDHHNEPLDPRIQQATADWIAGEKIESLGVAGLFCAEVVRTVASMLVAFGLFLFFCGLMLSLEGRLEAPALTALVSLVCWSLQGPEGPSQVTFWSTTALAVGFALVVARAGTPQLRRPESWRVGTGLLALFLVSWIGATLLNGLPGIRVQPSSLLYLPFFVPYKFICECYQLRGAVEALLVPGLPLGLALIEAIWPGKLGSVVWSWTAKLARSVSQFKLQVTFKASAPAWVALVITLGVAIAVWARVMAEGYDLNLASLLRLAGLLARIALLPLALFMLALRSGWSKRLLATE